MPTAATKYSMDSSSLIFAWTEAYPMDAFGSFWSRLETLAQAGRAFLSEEVHEELKRKDDDLARWAAGLSRLFKRTSATQFTDAQRLASKYPGFVDVMRSTAQADPFLVALAAEGHDVVVTSERHASQG